eukprot:1160287-Pelagomonas_calceolata.AAC.8
MAPENGYGKLRPVTELEAHAPPPPCARAARCQCGFPACAASVLLSAGAAGNARVLCLLN